MLHACLGRGVRVPPVDLLLRDVAPETRRRLDDSCQPCRFATGDELSAWHGTPERLHLIMSGRCKVWRPGANGQSVVLFFLYPGDAVGLLAICRGRANVASIAAAEPMRTRSWPAALVRTLLQEDAHMAANALEIVARRVELLADRVEDLSSTRADQQLARALLRLAGEDGIWSQGGEATVPVTRQDLADMTRSTIHTASRTLSGWQHQRLIRSTRGRVTITDPAALARIAGLAA